MSNNVFVFDGANKTAEQVQKEIKEFLYSTVHKIKIRVENCVRYVDYLGPDTLALKNPSEEACRKLSDEIYAESTCFDPVVGPVDIVTSAHGQFFDCIELDKPETWQTMYWAISVDEYCEEGC